MNKTEISSIILILLLLYTLLLASSVKASFNSPINLTASTEVEAHPSISGDGSKIAFQRGYDNDTEIFVVNSDGTGLTQLTNNNIEDEYLSISHTGERIVFGANNDIYLADYNSDAGITEPTPTPSPPQSEPTFTTEIIVGLITVLVITVLVIVYLKRK
jgi:Tol biopolymer transport system component